jgi:excisionase family DNA binding protein
MVAKDDEHEKPAGMTPLARAKAAAALMNDHRQATAQLAAVQSDALRALRDQGMFALDIAVALGISRQQVRRLRREPDAEDDGTLTVWEVAAALGAPPRRVYELIDEGRLPAFKRGRELRVQRALPDIERSRVAAQVYV